MDEGIKRYLTEAMGLKYHDVEYEGCGDWHCKTCNEWTDKEEYYDQHQNYSNWEFFGKLWEWAAKQEWWNDFVYVECGCHLDAENMQILINPTNFANAIHEYLKEA